MLFAVLPLGVALVVSGYFATTLLNPRLERVSPAEYFAPDAFLVRGAFFLFPLTIAFVSVANGILLSRLRTRRDGAAPLAAALRMNAWWLPLAIGELLLLVNYRTPADHWSAFVLLLAMPIAIVVSFAGWLASVWSIAFPAADDNIQSSWRKTSMAAVGFTLMFGGLSVLQHQALHVPHGDSAMYEEHLWNFEHGKGFRSELDDGRSFLGEHFEVIHLLLLPIHWLAPGLPTLNWCLAAALGSGAIAVWRIARRLELPPTAAWLLGLAYLLYFPMQYLCIEASWKTFRPENFAVPLVLFALAALEGRQYRTMLLLLGLSLPAKEEYAIVTAAIGLYLMFAHRRVWLGIAIIVLSIAFLAAVLGWAIPYFRSGAPPHYTPYFASFGHSPREIAISVLTDPFRAIAKTLEWNKLIFLILLLLPLGFLPLANLSRFAVSLPIFGYLLLGDLHSLTEPWFHFHAPLVPLLFWSACGGVRQLSPRISPVSLCRWIACLCLVTGFFYGRSPLSWRFYDPAAGTPRQSIDGIPTFQPMGVYWRDLYLPDARTKSFQQLFPLIRPDERVAATDYIRGRFTHHRAAHDYPTFRRHVTIDEIDVIVLDKTEGWWGRGSTNPDRELLACMNNPACRPGDSLTIRGQPFVVVYHDAYFLAVRRN